MLKPHNPPTVPKPVSSYAQAVEAPAGGRWLYISGQVGLRPDGTTVKGAAAQADQAWANVRALLSAADMGVENLVHVNTYLVNAADIAAVRQARDKVLKGHTTASTMVVVAALANPEWMIEIEAVAMKG
jgi:enamine deaminase RidA (YjgF/YER057c/UK114 family)